MIGTQLDKYEVLQKIGEGGMATVYRGRHATLQRDVAIKVLHPHLSSSTRNRKRFAREARAIEHLRHDNILEIFDYSGVDTSDCYIITEYVEGETLTELMNRCNRVPSEVAVLIGLALTDALAYAHRAGILHRDLKPDNVMVRADGKVKLMDFGIARFLDESQLTLTGALVGSPAFMSPEQAREESLDTRSDLFSLGTLLYYLVTGQLPFSGSNASLILKNIIEGNRPHVTELAPGVSTSLAGVIEQLLAVHREDRQTGAANVGEQLRACLDEVGFEPDQPRWELARFIAEPERYEVELNAFLKVALLDRGRALMQAGEQLAALRLFNRLLSLDEENAEALALIQGFHGVEAPSLRKQAAAAVLLLLGTLATGAALLWWRGPTDPGAPAAPTTDAVAARPARVVSPADPARPPTAEAALAQPTPEPPAPTPEPAEDEAAPTPAPAAVSPPTEAEPRRAPPPAPAEAPGEAPVAPPEPPKPACIAFRSKSAPAEVYLDEVRIGSTRDGRCYELPPGTYDFVLTGEMVREHVERVTLAAGQVEMAWQVELTPLPCQLRFASSYAPDCTVTVNGQALGTLGELRHQVMIERPDQPSSVLLQCDGKQARAEFSRFEYSTVTFDKPLVRP